VKGSISLQNVDREYAFTDADLRLLTTLANSMSVALESARLFQETRRLLAETEQRNAELGTINTISQAIAAELELNALIALIGEQMRRTFKADIAYVALHDRQTDLIHFPYAYGDEALTTISFGEGLTSRILRSGEPLLINRDIEARRAELGATLVGAPARSYVGVPIQSGGQAIGVLSVQSTREEGRFGEGDLRLLGTMAASVGAAIQNARLYQETQRRAEEMASLAEIGSDIAATHELEPVLERLADRARGLLRVRDIAFYLLQPDGRTLRAEVALGTYAAEMKADSFPIGSRIAGHIAVSGEAEIVNYPERDRRAVVIRGTPGLDEQQEALMAAPLVSRGRLIGLMMVWRDRAQGLFGQSELDFLVSLARQAAIAIESARLYMETERRANQMAAVAEVGREATAQLDLTAVLEGVAQRVHRLFSAQDTVLRLAEPDGRTYRTTVALGKYASQFKDDTIVAGQGITGSIAQSGVAEVIADVTRDPRGVHVPGTPVEEGEPDTLMCAPLIAGGRTIGLLSLYRPKAEGVFTPVDLDFLVALARQVATAIENARLYAESESQRAALRESQRLMSDIIEFLPDAALVIDQEGKVIAWNRAIEQMTGVPAAEMLGQGDHAYAIPFYGERRPILIDLVLMPQEEMEQRYAQIVRQGSTLNGESYVSALPRGPAYLMATASALHDSEGRAVGAIELIRDITERKRAEEELRQAKAAADSANEAKSAFLAMMSHEIRTPMNAIIGMSGLLLGTPLRDQQHDFAETIRSSGDALLTIINDILDFSKIEASRLELEEQPFDLRECIESALDLFRLRAAEKGLDLAYQIEPEVPAAIMGDITRLRQIVVNLLSNAVKFTEQGEVVVSISARALGGGAHELHFAVRDTGIGIPPDRIERLFQAFTQGDASTSRRYGGTGLGLAISKRLSELMGGRMWAESTGVPGQGSSFHFTIRAQAAAVPESRARWSGEQPILRGKRLLIVDDNATNRRILALQTRAWGILARDTASPHEALEWVRRGDPFDLAILDMHMPEMDGPTLATEIRQLRPAEALPLVLFSSLDLSSRGERSASDAALFAAYLAKPLKPSALFDALLGLFTGEAARTAAGPAPAPAAEGAAAAQPGVLRPLRILLAEDNAVNQKLAVHLLTQMGYRPDVAANGVEVLRSLERQPYDVVLMDVQMPEMDGLEATRQICARWARGQRPYIIAMTANAMQGDRERCLEAGMEDYVSKPIRVDELRNALAQARALDQRSEP
ncbi:MAG: GAF domain-containing protein, partial [Chloroflexota bacterium]